MLEFFRDAFGVDEAAGIEICETGGEDAQAVDDVILLEEEHVCIALEIHAPAKLVEVEQAGVIGFLFAGIETFHAFATGLVITFEFDLKGCQEGGLKDAVELVETGEGQMIVFDGIH